ncbi:Aspartokinase [Candidatus Tremblaya princeps]|uniref:aspartate kinase n=1 Tax=Tremblaya princeps TaxID=189385 RepID=A0A143WN00_TREPR|nr:Aspartokinase [Candidatus Tremblaya princeps]
MQRSCCGIRDRLQIAALTVAMGLGCYCVAQYQAMGNARRARGIGMGIRIQRAAGMDYLYADMLRPPAMAGGVHAEGSALRAAGTHCWAIELLARTQPLVLCAVAWREGMPMHGVVVRKYGGTSVAGALRLARIASAAQRRQLSRRRAVVVASAMSGETNRLVNALRRTVREPEPIAADAVVCTGEQVTIGLLSAALWERCVSNAALTGWQVPIVTNGAHTRSLISSVGTRRLYTVLRVSAATMVAGFQGVDERGYSSTLGRGGSDTTAAALSSVLRSPCLIYTDVPGVCTGDPRLVPSARVILRISYEEMCELAGFGSRVVHDRSLTLQGRSAVGMSVLSSSSGTCNNEKLRTSIFFNIGRLMHMDRPQATSVSYRRCRAYVYVRALGGGEVILTLGALCGEKIELLWCQHDGSRGVRAAMTSPAAAAPGLEGALCHLRCSTRLRRSQCDAASCDVSTVGLGIRYAQVACSIALPMLRSAHAIATSEIRISLCLKERDLRSAVVRMHYACLHGDWRRGLAD